MNPQPQTSKSKRTADMQFTTILAAYAGGRKTDAAAIRDAIAEAEAALPAAKAESAEIEKHRRAVLLTASDDELVQAERQVAEQRRMAERLEVALERLRELLAEVEEGEAAAHVQMLAEAFGQKLAVLENTWKKSYPGALATIQKLLTMEEQAETAFRLWDLGRQRLVEKHPGQADAFPAVEGFPSKATGITLLRQMVHLPSADGRLNTSESVRPRDGKLLQETALERLETLERDREENARRRAAEIINLRRREENFDLPRDNEVRRPRGGIYPAD